MANGEDLWEYGGVLGGQSGSQSLPQQTTGDGVLGRFKVRFSMTLFGGRFRTLERGTSFPVTEATERAPRNCKSECFCSAVHPDRKSLDGDERFFDPLN